MCLVVFCILVLSAVTARASSGLPRECCSHLDPASLTACFDSKKQEGRPQNRRIAMVTYSSPNIQSYSAYSAALQSTYASSHGYDFYKLGNSADFESPSKDHRWSKVKILKHFLDLEWDAEPAYDYVVWVDADLIFLNMSFSLNSLVTAAPDSDLILSAEIHAETGVANTGCIIAKNSVWTKAFLDTWWTLFDHTLNHDQVFFGELVQSLPVEDRETRVRLLPAHVLNSVPPAVIHQQQHHNVLHLMGDDTDIRRIVFSRAWQNYCEYSAGDDKKIHQLGLSRSVLQGLYLSHYRSLLEGNLNLIARFQAPSTMWVDGSVAKVESFIHALTTCRETILLASAILRSQQEGCATAASRSTSSSGSASLFVCSYDEMTRLSQAADSLKEYSELMFRSLVRVLHSSLFSFDDEAVQPDSLDTLLQSMRRPQRRIDESYRRTHVSALNLCLTLGNDVNVNLQDLDEQREVLTVVGDCLEDLTISIDKTSSADFIQETLALYRQALGEVEVKAQNYALSFSHYREAISILEGLQSSAGQRGPDYRLLEVMFAMAEAQCKAGDFSSAMTMFDRIHAKTQQLSPSVLGAGMCLFLEVHVAAGQCAMIAVSRGLADFEFHALKQEREATRWIKAVTASDVHCEVRTVDRAAALSHSVEDLQAESTLNPQSGVPQASVSGVPQVSVSGVPQASVSGVRQASVSGVPQVSVSGVRQASVSGVRQASVSGVPQASVSGVPQASVSGVPQASVSGVPQASVSGVRQASASGGTGRIRYLKRKK